MDPELAARLRAGGFDVLTVQESGMRTRPDEAIMEFASNAGRIVLTHDRQDYARIAREWATAGKDHSGVILCQRRAPATLAQWITAALALHPDMRNLTLSLPMAE